MIYLAFFLPLSIYLLILGSINRRRHPVMVSGVIDFIGILFAASGFLIFTGPGILSSLYERWRWFWLVGQRPNSTSEGFWQFWMFLTVLYFFVVVAGAALVFRAQRHLTSIYNADPELMQRCLVQVCEQMGLDPARSGNLFVFGVEPAVKTAASNGDGIKSTPVPTLAGPTNAILQETSVLEIESFARFRHVTLRWDPADSFLRREVEAGLQRLLADVPVETTELGIWLTMIGVTMFGLTVISGATLVAVRLYL